MISYEDNKQKRHVQTYVVNLKDKEVVKGVLLLTGSIEGTKQQVAAYTAQFNQYSFLWKDDLQAT